MLDKYAGESGTFYTDPETGTRMTEQEWLNKQAKKQMDRTDEKTDATAARIIDSAG